MRLLLLTVIASFELFALAEQPTIKLKVDVRNLLAAGRQDAIDSSKFSGLLRKVNSAYSKCGVQFEVRHIQNLSAKDLSVEIPPRSEAEMAAIADKINPNGFAAQNEAIPVTIAGPIDFFAPNYGINVHALTWSFTNGTQVVRMHSMISRKRFDEPLAAETLAHELGHLFLLSHSTIPGNVMGAGLEMSHEQCQQVRSYAQKFYRPMMENPIASL